MVELAGSGDMVGVNAGELLTAAATDELLMAAPPPICPAFDMGVGDCPDIDDILPCSFTIG